MDDSSVCASSRYHSLPIAIPLAYLLIRLQRNRFSNKIEHFLGWSRNRPFSPHTLSLLLHIHRHGLVPSFPQAQDPPRVLCWRPTSLLLFTCVSLRYPRRREDHSKMAHPMGWDTDLPGAEAGTRQKGHTHTKASTAKHHQAHMKSKSRPRRHPLYRSRGHPPQGDPSKCECKDCPKIWEKE